MSEIQSFQKIIVFTGTRADYGILRPLIRELESIGLNIGVLVSGTHLSELHGMTVDELERDGVPIVARIPILGSSIENSSAIDDFQQAIKKFGNFFVENPTSLLIVLGDRLEALAIAINAMIFGIPIAHIHGGEITIGAMDDKIRHSITKMSNLHFVSTDLHAKRLKQMGEQPSTVFNVGALALDNIENFKRANRSETLKKLNLSENDDYALVAYHPAQYEVIEPSKQFSNIIQALLQSNVKKIVITGVNSDIGSNEIRRYIQNVLEYSNGKVAYVESLGTEWYFNALSHANFAVGNSSSLVIEAPSIGTPVILVGNRQKGRPLASNVITTGGELIELIECIRLVSDPNFISKAKSVISPYGSPGVAKRMSKILKDMQYPLETKKVFFEILTQD